MHEIGAAAPDFTATDQDGRPVSLRELRGKKVVVYFYPKDNTPGCTKEACSFRDHFAPLQERGVVVLGVSPDSEASHRKFADKHQLPFTLLADPDHAVAEAFIKPVHAQLLIRNPRPGPLVDALAAYVPAPAQAQKWIGRNQT